jgi:hypothetical protein
MPFQFRKEAIEEDLNTNFPSQGQGNPPLYYSLSEVVVPTYSINNAAEGSTLGQNLQTAWDFSTGHQAVTGGSSNLITNTGFWQVDLILSYDGTTGTTSSTVNLSDGISSKVIWAYTSLGISGQQANVAAVEDKFVVFLRSGDTVSATVNADHYLQIWYRQIADVNGNLVNPLGWSPA